MPDEMIDKAYWLDQGYTLVHDAYTRLSQGISKVNTYLGALLTTYAGLSIFTAYHAQITEPCIYWLLVFPFIIASLGFVFTTLAVLPHGLSVIWTESWESCKYVVEGYIRKASKFLLIAKILALIGGVSMVCVQVEVFSMSKRKADAEETLKKSTAALQDTLTVRTAELAKRKACDVLRLFVKTSKTDSAVAMAGMAPASSSVHLAVLAGSKMLDTVSTKCDAQGLYYTLLSLKKNGKGNKLDTLVCAVTLDMSPNEQRTLRGRYALQ